MKHFSQKFWNQLFKLLMCNLVVFIFTTCRITEEISDKPLLPHPKKIRSIESYFNNNFSNSYFLKLNEKGNITYSNEKWDITYEYNADNQICKIIRMNESEDTIQFFYNQQGLLSYSLTKIRYYFSVFPGGDDDIRTNYELNSEKQLVKSQSQGKWYSHNTFFEYNLQNNMSRKITNFSTHTYSHRPIVVYEEKTAYDNKNNPFFQKINPFFHLSLYNEEEDFFIYSLSLNNPIEKKHYLDGELIRTDFYSYEYNTDGFPLSIKIEVKTKYGDKIFFYKIRYD